MLLGDDSDSEVKIEINKNYAGHYNSWRQKEELQKLRARYGEAVVEALSNSSDDSSSSEEDEQAEQLTQQLEKDFFKTLSCLKKRDPCIYDEKVSFFAAANSTQQQGKNTDVKINDKKKPVFLRDYERTLIVEREGQLSEDEDGGNECSGRVRPQSPTIIEEQNLIKESLKEALGNSDEDDDGEMWGRLFQKRHKTQAELENEEEDYREWLKGQREELSDKKTESELKYLHDYWNDPKLNSDEQFLKDYILNKRFLEANQDDDDDYIPTYDEIVHDSDVNLSEDEKTIEKQEEFEHKFNFRFEEPDKEFIKRYPRTMENSLRKRDDRRKRKRNEVKQRKEAEEARKREELKRLKSLKRKEIMEKIEKLKQVTGNDVVGFKDEDFEGDFDPEQHDKRMRQLFDSEYYEGNDSKKPEFPELDEELEIENWNTWTGRSDVTASQQSEHEPHCEDPDFNMDCDYDPANQLQSELIQASRGKKKGKKGSMFAQVVATKKPVFDIRIHQTFDQYTDEYYKLDFEDIIGDLPCRFKYRNVIANSFGLSIDEILKADDRDLNRWCSLKKAVQHRPEHVEKYDVIAYDRKSKNENLKRKIFHSFYSEDPSEQQTENEEAKSKQKRKHKKQINSRRSDGIESHDGLNKRKAVVDYTIQSNKTDETESVKGQLSFSKTSDQSSDAEIAKKKKIKKKRTKSEERIKFSSSTSVVSESVAVMSQKHNVNKVSGKKFWKASRQRDVFNNEEDQGISDARLRAYGMNPKKFKNKLKYGNSQALHSGVRH